jgi:predicted transcriptional regulator
MFWTSYFLAVLAIVLAWPVPILLSRLEKKGLVERERGTRPHRYQAVSSREDHTAELMHEVLGSAPDREAVLARFIGSVTESEAETLRKLLGHS